MGQRCWVFLLLWEDIFLDENLTLPSLPPIGNAWQISRANKQPASLPGTCSLTPVEQHSFVYQVYYKRPARPATACACWRVTEGSSRSV